MAPMTADEKSLTRGHGLLAARVSEVLSRVAREKCGPLVDEAQVLENGEELLQQFISGSQLVEGKVFDKEELAPRLDDMRALRHALSSLAMIRRRGKDTAFSSALSELQTVLRQIRSSTTFDDIREKDVTSAQVFFSQLTRLLEDDVYRQRLEGAAPRRPTPVWTSD